MGLSNSFLTKCMAEIESTYGTTPTWAPADDGFYLVDNANPVKLDTARTEPKYLRDTHTQLKDIVGRQLYMLEPKVYACGGGAAATPVRFNDLLRCSGLLETVAASSVVYTPRSDGVESASVATELDGVQYISAGCYGTFRISGSAGQPAEVQFSLKGKYSKPVNSAAFTAWAGGTVNAPTMKSGAVTIDNGTVIWSSSSPTANPLIVKSFTFDRGLSIGEITDWNSATGLYGLVIESSRPTLEITVQCQDTMTGLPDFWGDITDMVTHAVGFQIGISTGGIWLFSIPKAQLVDASPSDGEAGTRNYTLTYKIQHDTADTEFSIITK